MATIEIVETKRVCYCRGWTLDGESNAIKMHDIPKGEKALRSHIHGAGGWETAFYCKKCMVPVLEEAKKSLEETGII